MNFRIEKNEKREEKNEKKEEKNDQEDGQEQEMLGSPPESFKPIELELIDDNIFRASEENLWRPQGARGVFGGQVLGQSLAAAAKTVESNKLVHSLHSYFVRAASWKNPIIYQVHRIRDGNSYSTRLIFAQQKGKTIFIMLASFQKPEISKLDHQLAMPVVPHPDTLPTEAEVIAELLKDPRMPTQLADYMKKRTQQHNPIDMRYVTRARDFLNSFLVSTIDTLIPTRHERNEQPRQICWMKANGKLPDDPQVHVSVVAYASDHGLLGTAQGRAHSRDLGMMISLDHAMWFHAPFRADEWLLYVTESPRAYGGRGLSFGYIFRTDGVLAVTTCQEGLIRLKDRSVPRSPKKPETKEAAPRSKL